MSVKYSCKKCGLKVTIVDGQAFRSCKCAPDTGVIADLSATATGDCKMASK